MMNSTATIIAPTVNLTDQLHQIGLRALPTALDSFLEQATNDQWSPQTVLEQLAHAEGEALSRRRLERRRRESGVKLFKPMTAFDWNWPTKIDRDAVERALNLDFLHEAGNLLFLGPTGLGKSMIAQNLCHAAMVAGHSVLFRTATAILEELRRQSPEGRRRKIRAYANVGLLCIDEFGYLSTDNEGADVLCEVISRRYERKPVIVTTNRPFEAWPALFPNTSCIPMLFDRLRHHSETIVIEGPSYRLRESELEATARTGRG